MAANLADPLIAKASAERQPCAAFPTEGREHVIFLFAFIYRRHGPPQRHRVPHGHSHTFPPGSCPPQITWLPVEQLH